MKLNARDGKGTMDHCHDQPGSIAGFHMQAFGKGGFIEHPTVIMTHDHRGRHL
jgi:hypothetical protein